jgi:predicted acetylornithine/succinylornithine family transaminase
MSKSEEIVSLYKQFVMPTYAPKLALVRGKGTKVWDADGKVYLDFIAGISVVNVGHCHPRVVEAIQKQAGTLVHVSNLYHTENVAKLAEKLSTLGLKGKCFFCNSGAEANEALVKLARLWGHDHGKYEVITMANSFHGRTLAMVAATGQDKIKKGFEPMPEGFRHAEFNSVESVASLVNDKTVAVLVEAVQGEGGIIPATDGFMRGVRELCNARDLLMLCDEVQCGMGRTGNWFAYQAHGSGAEPDAFSLAKGLGNGYPIGAIVSGPKLADVFQPGKHASTFGGTPLACAAALATIEAIEEEGLVSRASLMGELIRKSLTAMAAEFPSVKEVRGRGLMIGLVLDKPAAPLVDLLTEMGLLTLATAGNVVRMLPPLNVKQDEVNEALDILHDALEQWQATAEPDAAAPLAAPAATPEPATAQA